MQETHKAIPAITLDHLTKHFPGAQRHALDDISLTVSQGETFGLLGPNGAGKTTAIRILTAQMRPGSGKVTIAGIDVVANPIGAKQRIAVVPQRNNLDRSLRVMEILTYHAAYHGVPRAERIARANTLLAELGLSARKKEKLGMLSGMLSGGTEQRLMLARALMHKPEVLFLDEPTNNLDPQTRLFLWERIRQLQAQGVSIVLTTHDMEEADRLCARIAIMDHGSILALDTPDGLKRLIPGGTMLELRLRVPETVGAARQAEDGARQSQGDHFRTTLARLPGVTTVERLAGQKAEADQPEMLVYRLYGNAEAGPLLASAAQAVIQEQGELLDLRFTRPSLEDVFIYLTGRNLRS